MTSKTRIWFLARAILSLATDSNNFFGFSIFLVIKERHAKILALHRRIFLEISFDRVAINFSNRLFDFDSNVLRLLDDDMHGVSGFVTGLVTEHADNRLNTVIKSLHAKRILFYSIYRPLDFGIIRRNHFVFDRRHNLHNRSLLIKHDEDGLLRRIAKLVHIGIADVVTNIAIVILCNLALFIQVIRNFNGIAVLVGIVVRNLVLARHIFSIGRKHGFFIRKPSIQRYAFTRRCIRKIRDGHKLVTNLCFVRYFDNGNFLGLARRCDHRALDILTVTVGIVGNRRFDTIDCFGIRVLVIRAIFRNGRNARRRIVLPCYLGISHFLDVLEFLGRYRNSIQIKINRKGLRNISCGILDSNPDVVRLLVHVNSRIVFRSLFNDRVNVFRSHVFTVSRYSHNRSRIAVANDDRCRTRFVLGRILISLRNDVAAGTQRIGAGFNFIVSLPFDIDNRDIHENGIRLKVDGILRFYTGDFDNRLFVDIFHLHDHIFGRRKRFVILVCHADGNRIKRIGFVIHRFQENYVTIRLHGEDFAAVRIFVNIITEISILGIRIVLVRLDRAKRIIHGLIFIHINSIHNDRRSFIHVEHVNSDGRVRIGAIFILDADLDRIGFRLFKIQRRSYSKYTRSRIQLEFISRENFLRSI